jgi:hypothetical protein
VKETQAEVRRVFRGVIEEGGHAVLEPSA